MKNVFLVIITIIFCIFLIIAGIQWVNFEEEKNREFCKELLSINKNDVEWTGAGLLKIADCKVRYKNLIP